MAKVVLITGASRGIGRAAARLAGARGWSVGVNYLGREDAAAAAVAEVEATGGRAVAIGGDVAVEADVIAMFDETEKAFGPVDVLVNNAGIVAPVGPLVGMSAERIRRVFDVNVIGSYLCAREAARRMARSRGGRGGVIVNISSAAATLGSPNEYVWYAASKGAIDAMTIGLSKELASDGIRVNAVSPGLIETEIHALSTGDAARMERLKPMIPLERVGSAEEVAAAVLFLMSDEASYITGTNLRVSGGR